MMRIVIDHVIATNGEKIGEEWIDTSAEGVLAMFSAWRHTGGPPDSSGWNFPSRHPDYPGATKYAVLRAEVERLNDQAARTALGI